MADPQTANKFLNQPSRGTDTGTWDTPEATNFGIIDNSFGGMATVAVTSGTVTLLSSQYQCLFLHITGALNSNTTVVLPSVGSFYSVINDTTNSSAFHITMQTTTVGARAIGLPIGTVDIMTDGPNVRFRALQHVGSYWHYSGSSTPAWVDACTVPPWLYCNGAAFSSATYPALNAILGSATLPDLRGRSLSFFNDGTGRITSALSGVNGDVLYSGGGAQIQTLAQANLPNMNFPVTDPGHSHAIASNNANTGSKLSPGGGNTAGRNNTATITVNSQVTGITVASGGSNLPFATVPPSGVSGITLIRAA